MIDLTSPEVQLLFKLVGVAGFALYVLNYAMLTFGVLSTSATPYFVVNFFAAAMVLLSLMINFNLASALIQVFWIFMSTIGIFTRFKPDRQSAIGAT